MASRDSLLLESGLKNFFRSSPAHRGVLKGGVVASDATEWGVLNPSVPSLEEAVLILRDGDHESSSDASLLATLSVSNERSTTMINKKKLSVADVWGAPQQRLQFAQSSCH